MNDGNMWYPFSTSPLECSDRNEIDLSKLLPKTNSKIIIKNGKFVNKDTGERIRFFGTNFCFSLAFPSKESSPLIAKRLSQLGINIVRFHHMDNQDIWLDNTDSILDPKKLDLLHYFLFCLHENNIYANINLHVSRIYPEPEFTSELQSKFHYGKCLDRFYPPFILDQMQYSLNLLNSYNKYTKCKLADDPMILNLELNNETTMFDLLNQDKFNSIKNTIFEIELHNQWTNWLVQKYQSFEAIEKEWTNSNDEIDYSFDLLTKTKQGFQQDCNSNFVIENDIYKFSVNQTPQFFWSNQIYFRKFPIEPSTFYTVEFEGKTDSQIEASVSISFQESLPPYKSYTVGSRSVKLTQEFTKFSIILESADSIQTEDPKSTIVFKIIMGTQIGEYYFKNIHVYKGRHINPFWSNEKLIENINLPCLDNSPKKAISDFVLFIDHTETTNQIKLMNFIKSSFPSSEFLIVDSQACFGNLFSYKREYYTSDFIDNHAYWDHPSFEQGFSWRRDHFSIRNTPMFSSNNFGTFNHLTMMKPYNKPYTISEYNHPFPNEHLHEKFPMLGSWSAFHDFDAIYQFAYGNSNMNYIEDYFSMCNNPLDFAFAPFAAFAFRKCYVSTSNNYFHLKIPRNFDLKSNSELIKPFYAGWPATFDIEFVGSSKDNEFNFDIDQKGKFETDQILWTDKIYQVNTPKLRTITGFIGNSEKSIMNDLGIVKISMKLNENLNESASVGILSLDDQDLEFSKKILFVVGGKVQNNKQKWTKDRKSTGKVSEGANWGEGPTLVQFIEFDAIFFFHEQNQPKIWTINQNGEKDKEINVSEYQWNDGKNNTKWKFSSNYSTPSLSFLIERNF